MRPWEKFSALPKLALDPLMTPLPFSSKQSLLYIPHVCLSMMRFTEMGLLHYLYLASLASHMGFYVHMHYSMNQCFVTFYDRITKPSVVITIVPSGHSPFEVLLKHVLRVCFEHLFSILFVVYLRGELLGSVSQTPTFQGTPDCWQSCLPVTIPACQSCKCCL